MSSAHFLKFLQVMWIASVPFIEIDHRYDAIVGLDMHSLFTFAFCIAVHFLRAMPIAVLLYNIIGSAIGEVIGTGDHPLPNEERPCWIGAHMLVFTLMVCLIGDMFAKIPAFPESDAGYLVVLRTLPVIVTLTTLLYYTTALIWRVERPTTERLTVDWSEEQKA